MKSRPIVPAIVFLAAMNVAGALDVDVSNLQLAGSIVAVGDNIAVFVLSESAQGSTDLNGDGDAADQVLHIFDANTRTVQNLGLAVPRWFVAGNNSTAFLLGAEGPPAALSVALIVAESDQGGIDLNDDGDAEDDVLHIYNVREDLLENVSVAVVSVALRENLLAFTVSEEQQGRRDLNDDGDAMDEVLYFRRLGEATETNLRVDAGWDYADRIPLGSLHVADGRWIVFAVRESHQAGRDLNEDGDSEDRVFHVYDTAVRRMENLGLAAAMDLSIHGGMVSHGALVVLAGRQVHLYDAAAGRLTDLGVYSRISYPHFGGIGSGMRTALGGGVVAVSVSERSGQDLNGDGDDHDEVLHIYDVSERSLRNVGISVCDHIVFVAGWFLFCSESPERFAVHMLNAVTGEMRNTEIPGQIGWSSITPGVVGESVIPVWIRETQDDLNGDGSPPRPGNRATVVHLYDVQHDQLENLRLDTVGPGQAGAGFFAFRIRESGSPDSAGIDLNGDGDVDPDDFVVHVASVVSPTRPFLRGDCNADGAVNITDAVFVLGFLFLGEDDPGCMDACDSNDDGALNITDAVTTLNKLFLGQGSIPPPGIERCGADPTKEQSELGCEEYESCPEG